LHRSPQVGSKAITVWIADGYKLRGASPNLTLALDRYLRV